MKPSLDKTIQRTDKVLILGCGNSLLSEHMFLDGYKDIISIDYSPAAIEKMLLRVQMNPSLQSPGLQYILMDACDLLFDDESMDVIIDKGLLDAIICGDNGTFYTAFTLIIELGKQVGHVVFSEVDRVLKPSTFFMFIILMYRRCFCDGILQ
jgi:2-polyprenyl-3-methyl-5-hydroxy-6-metoxy-1,4-benzoquinol methylase